MCLKNFKISVANALMFGSKVIQKRRRPSLPQLESSFEEKKEKKDLQHQFLRSQMG